MKRILWLAALLLAAGFGSRLFAASDVAKLQPVEVLRIQKEAGGILVETDTGEQGRGGSLEEAFENLKECASGDIFLDTVEFVLLQDASIAPELIAYLRPACQVCLERGRADLKKAAAFLDVHRPKATLMNCRKEPIPTLVSEEGRMELVS